MSQLAAASDLSWKTQFQTFKRRHLEAVYTLLNGKYLEEAIKEVEEGVSTKIYLEKA